MVDEKAFTAEHAVQQWAAIPRTLLGKGGQALAKRVILTSIIAWFVVDSSGSVLSGAPLNAVFNLSFLAIFCIPLWRMKID